MTVAAVATYKDVGTIRNVKDHLISTGIPSDAIKIDKEHVKIRVMVPDRTKAEIMEILNRHAPAEIHSAPEPRGLALRNLIGFSSRWGQIQRQRRCRG